MLHDTHSSTIYFLFVTFNTQAIESIIVIDVITISTTTAVIINLVPSELESRSRQGESKILFFFIYIIWRQLQDLKQENNIKCLLVATRREKVF